MTNYYGLLQKKLIIKNILHQLIIPSPRLQLPSQNAINAWVQVLVRVISAQVESHVLKIRSGVRVLHSSPTTLLGWVKWQPLSESRTQESIANTEIKINWGQTGVVQVIQRKAKCPEVRSDLQPTVMARVSKTWPMSQAKGRKPKGNPMKQTNENNAKSQTKSPKVVQ